MVGIERLLGAAADIAVDRLMDHDPPVDAPNTAQEIAAWVMVEHGEESLASWTTTECSSGSSHRTRCSRC